MTLNHSLNSELDWIREVQRIFRERNVLDEPQRFSDAPMLIRDPHVRINVDVATAQRHFPWPTDEPKYCGRRAFCAAVSDLAAAGCQPTQILLSLVIPQQLPQHEQTQILRVMDGIAEAAQTLGAVLIGGNVTVGHFAIHSIVTGGHGVEKVERGALQVGDCVWLTGTQGDAMLDLHRLSTQRTVEPELSRYWSPWPRLGWGKYLWQQEYMVDVTDISDGWLRDVTKFAMFSGSQLGLALDAARVPRSVDWRDATADCETSLMASYWGGDDYELAFVTRNMPEQDVKARLQDASIPATCIGYVTDHAGVEWTTEPKLEPPASLGYDPYLYGSECSASR